MVYSRNLGNRPSLGFVFVLIKPPEVHGYGDFVVFR